MNYKVAPLTDRSTPERKIVIPESSPLFALVLRLIETYPEKL